MDGRERSTQSYTARVVNAMKHACEEVRVRPAPLPNYLLEIVNTPLPRQPRALLFDIYGTLLSSSSGEVGSVATRATSDHFVRAWQAADLGPLDTATADRLRAGFFAAIRDEHARLRCIEDTVHLYPYPEVDIRHIWKRLVSEVFAIGGEISDAQLELLAACYEAGVNPVSPIPDARWAIETLSSFLTLGVVSNAQFYTRHLFPACIGLSLEGLGFDPDACALSYEHLRAKPDPLLFSGPLAYLQECGIDSKEVLYVGNDMRNDVAAATNAGCMTALFAGDERSLRIREDDPMTREVVPSTVVRSLRALVGLVTPEKESS